MSKKKIILVDDNPANLAACKTTLKDVYEVFPAPSADKMFGILKHIVPDLILLDVEMPVMNGYDAMRLLKKSGEYKNIPVIFVSAMDDHQSELTGFELGAVDYIHKPFVGSLLIRRIETRLTAIEKEMELLSLNKSMRDLLNRTAGGDAPQENLSRANREIRAPLNAVIDMIGTAMKTEDIDKIRRCLSRADIESRLILKILDGIGGVSAAE